MKLLILSVVIIAEKFISIHGYGGINEREPIVEFEHHLDIESSTDSEYIDFVILRNLIEKSIEELQRSFTKPLKEMVDDFTGNNALQIAKISRGRLILTQGLKEFKNELPDLSPLKFYDEAERTESLVLVLKGFSGIRRAITSAQEDFKVFNPEGGSDADDDPNKILKIITNAVKAGIDSIERGIRNKSDN